MWGPWRVPPCPPPSPVPRSLLSVALPSQSQNMVFLNADGHEIESLGLLPCSNWGRNIDKVVFKILYKYIFIELAGDYKRNTKHKISNEVSFMTMMLVGVLQLTLTIFKSKTCSKSMETWCLTKGSL